ncbi:MAG: type II secretion system protein M [Rhodocyclaceae bacterium]|nr:type II secretion system protein M [Rhodocyclaceae bacterium]MCW5617596.1 type II secretion system protein M [Rhodocyclaceae bacterium]
MIAILKTRLAALNPRERRLVLTATLLIGATLLYLLAEWTFSERNRLDKRLPIAETELTRMQAEAEELAQLRRLTPPTATSLVVRAQAARAAAAARQLDLVIDADRNGLRVTGSAPPGPLLDWLASMQAQQQLQPGDFKLESSGERLTVQGVLTPVSDR